MLPMKGPAEEAKGEDLEKFVVNDDLEKFFFFKLELSYQLKRKKSW